MSEWIDVSVRQPELKDSSVLCHFSNGSIETCHIEDMFEDITAGLDESGAQLYTQRYKIVGVTHWMPLPEPPELTEEES